MAMACRLGLGAGAGSQEHLKGLRLFSSCPAFGQRSTKCCYLLSKVRRPVAIDCHPQVPTHSAKHKACGCCGCRCNVGMPPGTGLVVSRQH